MCNSGLSKYSTDFDDDMSSDISDVLLSNGNDDNISFSCASNLEKTGDKDTSQILSDLRKKNTGRLIIDHLNINSLCNKFEELKFLTQGKIDILMISETKLEESFPTNQFLISDFSAPFRLDRNDEGGVSSFISEKTYHVRN